MYLDSLELTYLDRERCVAMVLVSDVYYLE